MPSPSLEKSRPFSMDFGTTIIPDHGVLFRLWAPAAERVDLCLIPHRSSEPQILPMSEQADGWFAIHHAAAEVGDLYQYRINGATLVPDPASRYQAADVHGPSVVYDPTPFPWQDNDWHGRPWEETVIYELHVGAFSPAANYAGVRERLDYLVELGITAIELMPIAQFPGRRDWGYDGTLLFAPYNGYGRPEELKTLIQEAHRRGLMIFLDVVYNHFGPEGNYLHLYAREAFFTERYHTPWGAAINFSGPQSRTVRDFYIANALYWLNEYHFDGLRFDAVHAIADVSRPDILEEIAAAVHHGPGQDRCIHLMLENDNNYARYLSRTADNRPRYYTAQWNDDIHHACHTLLTDEKNGYYQDYADAPIKHLSRCLTEGFAYQGETSAYRHVARRGEPSGHLPAPAFIAFLQNHDQIGNRAFGERLHTLCPQEELLIVISLLLLAPSVPLLFMGEEFGASTPFYFFCDFEAGLAPKVTAGRRQEFARFPQYSSPESRDRIPDPNAAETFIRSQLDWNQLGHRKHTPYYDHYRQLLQLRHREIIPLLPGMQGGRAQSVVLNSRALQAWWQLGDGATLTTVFNLHDHPVSSIRHVRGREIYRWPANDERDWDGETIGPKSIVWFVSGRENDDG
jgi:maltooligosyltrehalose trehalohydrolase